MMLIPRRNYGLNLFDEFFNDPFFSGSTEKGNDSKKLPIMRTDIMEKDGNYLMEIELPGFKKEDIKAISPLRLNPAAPLKTRTSVVLLSIRNATPVPARDPSLWENRSDRKISRLVLKTAS